MLQVLQGFPCSSEQDRVLRLWLGCGLKDDGAARRTSRATSSRHVAPKFLAQLLQQEIALPQGESGPTIAKVKSES